MEDLWIYEKEALSENCRIIAGTDEVGRGPLAGPVYAAAVILPFGLEIKGLNDSKKLSAKKREELYPEIREKAIAFAVAEADIEEIETLNILRASQLAMKRAVGALSLKPDMLLIDGNYSDGFFKPYRTIIGGDSRSASIAAASVLAKVERDRLMISLAEIYPEYGFEKNKGYGSEYHRRALLKYGPCEIHRPSFLRKILG